MKGTDESLNIIPLRTHNPRLHKSIPDILHQSSQPKRKCQALVPLSPHSPLTNVLSPQQSLGGRGGGAHRCHLNSELGLQSHHLPPVLPSIFATLKPDMNFTSPQLSSTSLLPALPFQPPQHLSLHSTFVKNPALKISPQDITSVQFSRVQLFATSWTTARQALLSITNSQSGLKLMSFELVMPSNHLILCHPLLPPQSFPASGSFPVSQFFASGGQSIGFSVSVPPMNSQD